MLNCALRGLTQFYALSSGVHVEFAGKIYTLTVQVGGILGISKDRDDQRIFRGSKFLIRGFFWVGKYGN